VCSLNKPLLSSDPTKALLPEYLEHKSFSITPLATDLSCPPRQLETQYEQTPTTNTNNKAILNPLGVPDILFVCLDDL